jgi:menaquinone-dependent protoporphyrinogen oxidase
MKVLIAVASRHGATLQIAERVAAAVRSDGHVVDLLDVTHGHHGPDAVDGYDAFLIGSAIYEGRWLRGARQFTLDHAIALQGAPVWLFSSGPLDDDDAHVGVDTRRVDELIHAVDAIEHRLFSGRLDRAELGRLERWIADVVRAHDGDFRDWDAIDAWAASVVAALGGDRPD